MELSQNKLILLVEDTPALAEVIVDLLTIENYPVVVANHGVGAMEIARSRAVDLVITDLLMPEMDGFTLIKKLREDESLKSIPIIVLTACDVFHIDGANQVLRKPCRLDALIQAIERMLR
jgi:CheY-like chemotaxis protein